MPQTNFRTDKWNQQSRIESWQKPVAILYTDMNNPKRNEETLSSIIASKKKKRFKINLTKGVNNLHN